MERKCYVKGFAYCLFSIYVAYCCRRSQKGRKSSEEVTSDFGWACCWLEPDRCHRCSEGRACASLGKREIGEFGKARWKIKLKLWVTGGLREAGMEEHCVLLCYLYSTLSCLALIVDIIVSPVNEQTAFWAGQESISRSVCLNSSKISPPLCVQRGVCYYLPYYRDSRQPQSLLCASAKWNTPSLPVPGG